MAWFKHDGSNLWYEDEGAGPPVLVLPGWSMSIDDLGAIRKQLIEARYRVIAVDPPGSGRSEPQPRLYEKTYYHDDAAAFLALLRHLSADPAHLVGFSDGGEYALVMAELEPTSVRSVFTWGAAGSMSADTGIVEFFANLIDNPPPGGERFAEGLKKAYGAKNARIMSRAAGQAFGEIIADGGDISRARATEITCPLMMLAGEKDFLAPPAVVADFAAAVPGAQFVAVDGVGHAIHETKPEWFFETLLAWLETQRAKHA